MSWKPPSIGSREDFVSPRITRRSALLEAHTNARNALAEIEGQPLPLAGWRRTRHFREIKRLKTNAEGFYELYALELVRSVHRSTHLAGLFCTYYALTRWEALRADQLSL